MLDGVIVQTEKEKETKPIAEETTLIAEETVSTKKTAKVERTDLALENTELRPERTEKVEKDKKTKRTERTGNTGRIELPLCLNPLDRPRQMVSREHGKEAITEYQIISESERITSKSENTFIYPLTGRTHQLRVHAAHPEGLGCPILGDELYGKKADRLYLHAEYIEFRHPIYGDILCIQKEADFHKKYD